MDLMATVRDRMAACMPGVPLEELTNPGVLAQSSLVVRPSDALAVAQFLRNDPALLLDYASNVTGIDWPETVSKTKVKVKKVIDGFEREFEETREEPRGGYLEAVYHLYSMALKHGPITLRQRTANRSHDVRVASLTPVWRGAEFQEREIFDLYGIIFEGHPDLRRILMWEGFADHPMRRDYVEPDDYEWEPTPHGEVLDRAGKHYPGRVA